MSKGEFLIIMCTSTHTASFSAYELLYPYYECMNSCTPPAVSQCMNCGTPAAAAQCMNWWCSDVAPPPYGRLPPPPLSGAPGQTKATLLPFPKTSPYYIITSCIAPITIGNHLPSF